MKESYLVQLWASQTLSLAVLSWLWSLKVQLDSSLSSSLTEHSRWMATKFSTFLVKSVFLLTDSELHGVNTMESLSSHYDIITCVICLCTLSQHYSQSSKPRSTELDTTFTFPQCHTFQRGYKELLKLQALDSTVMESHSCFHVLKIKSISSLGLTSNPQRLSCPPSNKYLYHLL